MNLAVSSSSFTTAGWWQEPRSIALVKRTYARDTNHDEFEIFVRLCRELRLSPIKRQVYAFVFNKSDPNARQLSLVVGIDGARSIAARTHNYQPDEAPPEWEISEEAKNPLTNPHGIVSCTVGVYHRPTPKDPFRRIVGKVFWDEFAPIVKAADQDAYEWVGTGEIIPEGQKNAGRERQRRQLRPGAEARVSERLDPKKPQWAKQGRNLIAKCAEMQALRKGWPEDLATLNVEEETDRHASIIDADYSEVIEQAEAADRLARIGGPAMFACFDDAGTLETVPVGKFADRVIEHTAAMAPADVLTFMDRNRVGLQAFWAHNKTDALALKRILEQRAQVPA